MRLTASAAIGAFSRAQSSATVITRPETISSSHWTSRDGADEARPTLEPFRPDSASRCVVRKQDLAASLRWWLPPGNCERSIILVVGYLVLSIRLEAND
jgi:hypothetical protein